MLGRFKRVIDVVIIVCTGLEGTLGTNQVLPNTEPKYTLRIGR